MRKGLLAVTAISALTLSGIAACSSSSSNSSSSGIVLRLERPARRSPRSA